MSGSSVSPWFKALVTLVAVGVAEIAYVAYRVSQPTVMDLMREVADERGSEALLIADLAVFHTAQEAFKEEHGHYTATVDSLAFEPSAGVTFLIVGISDTSWVATADFREQHCLATSQSRFVAGSFEATCD